MEIGRRLVEKELRKYGVPLKKFLDAPALAPYLQEEGLARVEDLYSRIGFGKTETRNVLTRLFGEEGLTETPVEKPGRIRQAVSRILPFGAGGSSGPITVKGQGDLLAYLAKCCNPLPGEEIVGYITRGRGVSVHSVECPNVKNLLFNPEREIEVQWGAQKDELFLVGLSIETADQPGILARLTDTINRLGSNITQIDAETFETGRAAIGVVCQLKDRKQLDRLLNELEFDPGSAEGGPALHRRRQDGGRSDLRRVDPEPSPPSPLPRGGRGAPPPGGYPPICMKLARLP